MTQEAFNAPVGEEMYVKASDERSKVNIHRGMTGAELDSVLKDKECILSAEKIGMLLAVISGSVALAQARKATACNPLFTLPDFDDAPAQSSRENAFFKLR